MCEQQDDPETGPPVHLAMPVDANGDGPAGRKDTVRIICWCGIEGCREWARCG